MITYFFCSKGHIIQFQCCELMFLTTLNPEEFTSTIFGKQKGRVIIWKQKIYFRACILGISLSRSFRVPCSRTLLVGIYHKKKNSLIGTGSPHLTRFHFTRFTLYTRFIIVPNKFTLCSALHDFLTLHY